MDRIKLSNLSGLNNWLRRFDRFIRLDSNQYTLDKYAYADGLVACGIERVCTIKDCTDKSSVSELANFFAENKGRWIFGHLTYEAKDLFDVSMTKTRVFIPVECISFFVPEYVLEIKNSEVIIHKSDISAAELLKEIEKEALPDPVLNTNPVSGHYTVDHDTYTGHVQYLIGHIHRGDIYEVNYCQSVHYENIKLDPFALYSSMQQTSSAPFGAFYKLGDTYLCSASPERFLAKRGDRIVCQPIKGTNRRLADQVENKVQQEKLRSSLKERSENVMIVDLMRNDMSKICLPGSVAVEELYGIYAFKHVNQMISTVAGTVDPDINFMDVMKALFPMGSMTGAPKLSALALIDELEPFRRGLFSGTVGYIDPLGNWDFNVIIRSIIYDDAHHLASISAGGAITALSDPEEEYQESLLKMEGLINLLK